MKKSAVPTRLRFWPKLIIDFFWPRDLTANTSDEFDSAQHAKLALHLEQALAYNAAARVAFDSRLYEPALFNYWQATRHAICCSLVPMKQEFSTDDELVRQFLLSKEGQELKPAFRDLLTTWTQPGSRVAEVESKRRGELADRLVERLLASLPVRTKKQLRTQRVMRLATAALVIIATLLGYRAWLLYPRNLSYGRPVTASSVIEGKHAGGIVDEIYTGFPAFVSKKEREPWVQIDLGRPYMVTDARVVGRHDCCFSEGLPVVFEVSVDGENYQEVSKRNATFLPLEPWLVPSIMRPARYVRLRSERNTTLALTEVYVYGRALN